MTRAHLIESTTVLDKESAKHREVRTACSHAISLAAKLENLGMTKEAKDVERLGGLLYIELTKVSADDRREKGASA